MLAPDAPLCSINDHVVEPPGLWARRLPAAMRADGPHIVTDGGDEAWVIGAERLTVRSLSVLAADGVTRPAACTADMHPAVHDPAARLAAMDDDGVAVQVLLPHVIGFAGERLRFLADASLWTAAARAYNDFLADELCAAAPDRLVGVAVLPLHDPHAATAELERAAGRGLRGASFPHDPRGLGLPTLYGGNWDLLLDAAAANGMPVFAHVGSSGAPPSVQGLSSPAAVLTLGGLDVAIAAVDFVCSGALARRPDLRLVLLEGGAGVLPYLAERMEFFARRRPELWDRASTSAAAVLRAQVGASFIDDPLGVGLRTEIGVAQLFWQSDFPHADSFWPRSREHLAELLRDVSDADAAAIAGGNTRALLGV
jgi:predicted TIM-barrel fold metal-dependent hydrolase